MVLVRYQCLILLLLILILAVGPTVELFMRKSVNEGRARLAENERAAVRKTQILSEYEGSGYRPNERDKPAPTARKNRPKRSADNTRSDAILFPDQVPVKSQSQHNVDNRLFVLPNSASPPSCARGDTFCEAVDEYPVEHVTRILRKEPVFLRRFFQDDRKEYGITEDNVEDRIDASDESPLCVAQEQIVYPKMAKNIEGNWLFVINQDEYRQGVRVEKCVSDRECWFPASLPNGYRSQCKQKYIYRKLVALNGTGQGVVTDSFPLPSCCSCVIRLDRNLVANRVGGAAPLPLTLPKTTPTPRP